MKLEIGKNDLATTNPGLAAEWDQEKNGDLTPKDVTAGSEKKIWWKCPRGHSWQASIFNRSRGTGCPVCAGRNVLVGYNDLATTNPDIAAEWDQEKNGDLTPKDVTAGSHKRVWWQCPQGHGWQASVYQRASNRGCPICTGKQVLEGVNDLATTNPDIAAEWDQEKNGDLTPKDVTAGSHKKVWWRCPKGHSWKAQICNRSAGSGCPICFAEKGFRYWNPSSGLPLPGKDLSATHPALAAQWDVKKNGGRTPNYVTAGSKAVVWWRCSEGHSWKASICNRAAGSGCPVCAGKQVLEGFNDLATTNPDLASEWDQEKNDDLMPQNVTAGSPKKVWWKCPRGHSWQARIADRSVGRGCPVCAGKQVLEGFNDLATTNPVLASEWDQEKNGDLTPQHITEKSDKKVWWRCPRGHSWQAKIENRANGSGCPICAHRMKV